MPDSRFLAAACEASSFRFQLDRVDDSTVYARRKVPEVLRLPANRPIAHPRPLLRDDQFNGNTMKSNQPQSENSPVQDMAGVSVPIAERWKRYSGTHPRTT